MTKVRKMNDTNLLPTNKQIEKFEVVFSLLQSAVSEMSEFAKKKPDGIINKLKIKILNRILSDIKELLKSEQTIQYLDMLDEESLPIHLVSLHQIYQQLHYQNNHAYCLHYQITYRE